MDSGISSRPRRGARDLHTSEPSWIFKLAGFVAMGSATSDLLNIPVGQLSLGKLGTLIMGRWEHASLRLDIFERSEIRSIILQPAFGASVPSRHDSSFQVRLRPFWLLKFP